MMKKLFVLIILFFLFSCQDGPRVAFNEEFINVNPQKELSFKKLIGQYKLDNDSKKRYGIIDSSSYYIYIKDNELLTNKYINTRTREIQDGLKKNIYYVNNYKEKSPSIFIGVRNHEKDDFYSDIAIYYRKKDSILALYIYTPPLKGQENGDYLRYIKVK